MATGLPCNAIGIHTIPVLCFDFSRSDGVEVLGNHFLNNVVLNSLKCKKRKIYKERAKKLWTISTLKLCVPIPFEYGIALEFNLY